MAFSIIDGDNSDDSHCLLFYGIEELIEDYEKRCAKKNISFDVVRKSKGLDFKSYLSIIRSLNRLKPQVIILHSSSIILPVWLYSFFSRCSLISVEHTPVLIKTQLDWVFSFINHALANYTVLLTQAYFEVYKKKLRWIRTKKITIISNGIDTNIFKNLKKRKIEKKIVIGTLGRLSPSKDHQTLISAIKILIDKGYDIQLKIAGDGEVRGALESYVNYLKLNSYIEFLGLIEEDKIPIFFNNVRIYAHPSMSETMSTSIMQALACGKPIVAADIEGNAGIIEDGNTGILFQVKNEVSLAEKIESLMLDDYLQKTLSQNSRNFALSHLSQEKMSKSYKKLYN